MACQRCNSDRVASISSKSSDLNCVSFNAREKNGYVPEGMGIGGGDYVEFDWCLDCGQIQVVDDDPKFPLPLCEMEEPEEK